MSMVWIAGQTVSGSAAQITFSSIPQTFSHLQIRITGRHSGAVSLQSAFIQLNGFGGSYPYFHTLVGDGSSATSGAGISSVIILPSLPGTTAAANTVGSVIVDILDYTNTNKNKTVRAIGGADLNGSGVISLTSGFNIDTTALSSVTVGGAFTSPYSFAVGTRADLYGITTSSVTGA